MIFPVVAWPHELLRTPAIRVITLSEDIRALGGSLLDTIRAAGGASLCAQQTQAPYRVFAVRAGLDTDGADDIDTDDGAMVSITAGVDRLDGLVCVNPELVSLDGKPHLVAEGCLSFPSVAVQVKRAPKVTIKYVGLDGREHRLSCGGLMAQAIQHELEHLDGRLLFDHAGPAKRKSMRRQFPATKGRVYDWSPGKALEPEHAVAYAEATQIVPATVPPWERPKLQVVR